MTATRKRMNKYFPNHPEVKRGTIYKERVEKYSRVNGEKRIYGKSERYVAEVYLVPPKNASRSAGTRLRKRSYDLKTVQHWLISKNIEINKMLKDI